MRTKHFGADGEVKFVPHRNVFVGFMGGRVVVTKKSELACKQFLETFVKPASNTDNIKNTIVLQVADVWKNAAILFPEVMNMPTPRVEFFNRGRTAGKAFYMQHKVTFNEVLASENSNKFINTVIHECAHLVVHRLFPLAKAHGREFKMIMRKMGGDGERCHSYDTTSVRVLKTKKRYVYSCSCTEHFVTQTLHSRIQRSGGTCPKCKSRVAFTGNVKEFK